MTKIQFITIQFFVSLIIFVSFPQAKTISINKADKVLLLKKADKEGHYELYFYPYHDNKLLHLTLLDLKNQIVKIENIPEKDKYKNFLEDTLRLFSNYLSTDTQLAPGKKYHSLISLFDLFPYGQIQTKDVLIVLDGPSDKKVDNTYLKSFLTSLDSKKLLPTETIEQKVKSGLSSKGVPLWQIIAGGVILLIFFLIAIFVALIWINKRNLKYVEDGQLQLIKMLKYLSAKIPQLNHQSSIQTEQPGKISSEYASFLKKIDEYFDKLKALDEYFYYGDPTDNVKILPKILEEMRKIQQVDNKVDPKLEKSLKFIFNKLDEISKEIDKIIKENNSSTDSKSTNIDW